MNHTVEINLPINKVVELFIDKNNFKEWKIDFVSYEHISRTSNEVGSVDKLIFKRVTMIEIISSINLPAEIIYEYEHKQGKKTIIFRNAKNHFTSLSEKQKII